MILTTTTLISQRAEPTPLWSGLSRNAASDAGRHGFPATVAEKRSEAAPRVSPLARRNGAPHEWGAGGESAPPFLAAGAARGREKGDRENDTLFPPCGEVALTTVIPAGRLSSRPGGRLEERQTTDGPQAERGKPGGGTQPNSSDPQQGQLATPLDGPGRRDSGVEPSQDLSANVPNSPVDSGSIRGI